MLQYKFPPMLGPAEHFKAGSLEWAERMSCRLQIAAETLNHDTVHHLIGTMHAIWQTYPRPWEIWPEGQPFLVPDDYCRIVTGHDWDALMTLAKEFSGGKLNTKSMRAELARAQAKYRKQGTRTDLLRSNATKLNDRGAAYLLRRLARDEKHKPFLDAYERGEYRSIRAAAKAAGIIRDPTPLEQIKKLIGKLSASELEELIAIANVSRAAIKAAEKTSNGTDAKPTQTVAN